MAGRSPKFEPYVETKELFTNYLERFEFFLTANEIDDAEKKKTVLLSCIGAEAYGKIRTQLKPGNPQGKTFDEVVAAAKLIYKQQMTVIGLRNVFMSRKRKENESVSEFAMTLREMCGDCEFPVQYQDQALRDVFTMGLNLPAVQAKLMLLDNDLTFDDAYKSAQAEELARKCSVEFNTAGAPSRDGSEVHKVEHGQGTRRQNRNYGYSDHNAPNTDSRKSSYQNESCFRCGGKYHTPDRCRYKNEQCYSCKKRGHISKLCPDKSNKNKGRDAISHVQYDTDGDEDTSFGLYGVYTVYDSASGIHVDILLDGKNVPMQVDTGAVVSLVSEYLYRGQLSHIPLQRSTMLLKSYTGDPVAVIGKIEVPVMYNDQSYTLPLMVTPGRKHALMGRDWLNVIGLNWANIFNITDSVGVNGLVHRYADLFNSRTEGIKDHQAKLTLRPEVSPVFQKARSVPYSLRAAVDAELDRLESNGIFYPVESSDWASPTVNVPKMKNGKMSVRICGDYKQLNLAIEDNKYPLPTAQDLFAKMVHQGRNPTVFSLVDLSGAFNQLTVTEESAPYMTLNTHKGLYRTRRLSYGVKTAPAIFQSTMDQILNGIENVMCFIDDILVIGENEEHHLHILEAVLARLKQHNVRLNKSKCQFMRSSVQYLGHIVSSKGIQPISSKVEAITKAPVPQNLTELQSFLGIVQYYARFVPNLSSLLHPLYDRLKAGIKWSWDRKCEEAFNMCKESLSSNTVLTHYDVSKPLILACDASPYGVGVVISHDMGDGLEKPIAFASRTLSPAEQNYSQIEREGLAIIFGLKKFNVYLFGRHFTLVTDHRPLTRIFGPKTGIPALAASRIQRWALILAGYQYDIQFKTSKQNANADALSRLPVGAPESAHPDETESINMMLVDDLPVTAKKIAEATRKDPTLARVYDYTHHGWPKLSRDDSLYPYYSRHVELSLEDGCILWGRRVIIPSTYREQILIELHAMHPGIVRMKSLARGYLWWPGLDADIEDRVRSCTECAKVQNMPVSAPLHPWPWANLPWQRIHIDFAEKDGQHFLIVVDSHSKWLEVVPMTSTTSSKTIVELRRMFAAYGLPVELVSDNGPQLVSDEFETFLKRNGVKHTLSPPYHPASNGLAERNVQTFKQMLKKSNANLPLQHRVSDILFQFRNTPHSLTGKTPAELFLLRAPRTRLALAKPNLQHKVIDKQITEMKQHHTAGMKHRFFDIYQRVKVRNMRGGSEKWSPGTVIEILGPLTYHVRFLGNVRRVVHVDHMIPDDSVTMDPTPLITAAHGPPMPIRTNTAPSIQPPSLENAPTTTPGGSVVAPSSSSESGKPDVESPMATQTPRRSQRIPKPVQKMNL